MGKKWKASPGNCAQLTEWNSAYSGGIRQEACPWTPTEQGRDCEEQLHGQVSFPGQLEYRSGQMDTPESLLRPSLSHKVFEGVYFSIFCNL